MAGRRTNLALLWASVLAFVTGVSAFVVGTPSGFWVVVAHGVIALAIVVLVPWKATIASRGWARSRSDRLLSIGLSATTLLALASGVLLVTGAVDEVAGLTTMQLHVAFGLLAVSLTLAHTLQRPVPHRRTDFSRRNVLRTGGLLVAAGGLWLGMEALLDLAGLRGGVRRFTGSHEITDPERVPATQWINDSVQHLDRETHQVDIVGIRYSVGELEEPADTLTATLDCTGGWFTTQEWSGTRLSRLVGADDGTSLVVRSTTGYWRRFPMDHAGQLLLATHMAGRPLPDGNGGPVRLVAPNRRGYWWVKWVDRVEIDDRPAWWQPPLPMA
jgi:DMSO/TMAO reductase YedYZ molybdopterin-dependent catalytic subunit